jgi:hypothetical protein
MISCFRAISPPIAWDIPFINNTSFAGSVNDVYCSCRLSLFLVTTTGVDWVTTTTFTRRTKTLCYLSLTASNRLTALSGVAVAAAILEDRVASPATFLGASLAFGCITTLTMPIYASLARPSAAFQAPAFHALKTPTTHIAPAAAAE